MRIAVVEEVDCFGVGGDASDDFQVRAAQVGGIVDDRCGFDALRCPIFGEELVDLLTGTEVLLSLADRSYAGLIAAVVSFGVEEAGFSLGEYVVAVFN